MDPDGFLGIVYLHYVNGKGFYIASLDIFLGTYCEKHIGQP